ncbi:MAG: cupin domain-containing protein [bacterium]
MENVLVDIESMTWQERVPGARFKAFVRDGKQLRLVEISTELVEPDWCLRGHIGYVLQGEMEINFNGRLKKYKPGQGIFIPGGKEFKHKLRVLSQRVRLILVEDI